MFSHLRFNKLALALTVGFTAMGCGKSGKSDKTSMSFNPGRPIVITADATLSAEKKVTGPWFRVSYKFNNSSDTKISLFALKVTVTGTNNNGGFIESEAYLLPSDANYSFTQGDTSVSCVYSTFGEWAPGDDKYVMPLNLTSGCSQTLSIWYLGSLPGGKEADSFRYKVEVEPIGWFGSETNAEDRYKKKFLFYTQ